MLNDMIDTQKIRTLLKFDGMDTSDLSDEELEIIIESKINELEGFIGVDLVPRERSKIVSHFHNHILGLNFYPIVDIVGVYVNDCFVKSCHYNVNWKLGIIYFDKPVHGVVRVDYVSGVDTRVFTNSILPLLKDMIGYSISFGNANSRLGGWGYLASSLHEGDVSISFGGGQTNGKGGYGYSSAINSLIDSLRERYQYSARVRLL